MSFMNNSSYVTDGFHTSEPSSIDVGALDDTSITGLGPTPTVVDTSNTSFNVPVSTNLDSVNLDSLLSSGEAMNPTVVDMGSSSSVPSTSSTIAPLSSSNSGATLTTLGGSQSSAGSTSDSGGSGSSSVSSPLSSSIDFSNVTIGAAAGGIHLFQKKYFNHADYETLDSLLLSDKKNIGDIVHFTNLKRLTLVRCNLKDLTQLNLLPSSLEELILSTDYPNYRFVNRLTNLNSLAIRSSTHSLSLSDIQNPNIKTFEIRGIFGDIIGDLSHFSQLDTLSISYCNINNLDVLKGQNNLRDVQISNTLITDVSALYGMPIQILSLTNNSIQELDITQFPDLTRLYIKGNYNLYTQELLDYCLEHDISIDITQEDINDMNKVRKMVEDLPLEGRSDIDKENIIYSAVLEFLDYKLKTVDDANRFQLHQALTGEGVCVSYAVLFKAMCEAAGIHAFTSSGGSGMFGIGHAWNMIEVDGQYYLCDPTWSDSIREASILTLDPRVVSYKARNLWKKLFGDDDGTTVNDAYYNVYGDAAKKFMKKHHENYYGGRDDYLYLNDMALTVVTLDTSTEEGQELAIDAAISSTSPIGTGIREITQDISDFFKGLFSNDDEDDE